MIVPSMSETTTWSVDSQRNIRAVHATAPDAEREKVIVFEPALRSNAFYKMLMDQTNCLPSGIHSQADRKSAGASWRIVFRHRPPGLADGTLRARKARSVEVPRS